MAWRVAVLGSSTSSLTSGFMMRPVTAHYSSMHAAVKMLASRIELLIQLLQSSQASAPPTLPPPTLCLQMRVTACDDECTGTAQQRGPTLQSWSAG